MCEICLKKTYTQRILVDEEHGHRHMCDECLHHQEFAGG